MAKKSGSLSKVTKWVRKRKKKLAVDMAKKSAKIDVAGARKRGKEKVASAKRK